MARSPFEPATPPETLITARHIALKNGIRYAYTGNIHDEQGASTYCHQCQQKLIGRDWHQLTAWHLKDSRCEKCGTPCPGVFEDIPGNWGRKRMPVSL